MDESRRNAIRFLEKEIKTYTALSLFFSKKGFQAGAGVRVKRVLLSPSFYKERVKEAKKLADDLRETKLR